jgi:hypothetical protein
MLGDLAHMVERLLRMREALGSIPRISILIFAKFIFIKETVLATYTAQNDDSSDDNPIG